ncbi:AcrR family transcriptional regulator [Amycolatopsis bartoniae]|uniref:TetR family transcriptional regulator n=1 Tax=Amycolatopsis bartoniae TaxID=941986 RepID=A0A8H9M408_9PSEU|nr:AcrR family transcriptional regulator [Amycolatopsis bartoniae]TVT00764.1 TetR/AcrR family transcriptional regulator [Amycolatopsis bartoniae]GHF44126.1 TetR family transcriptional regulator [Amycolatopsis bartoniae]
MSTEERVRHAAVRLFAEKGFHGTGIRELAQEAGISSASLYHYMGTKEDLLVAIMRECLDRLLRGARQAVDGVADPRRRLASLVSLHVLVHARQPAETRVVDNEVPALSESARKEVVGLRDQYEQLWADAIDDGLRHRVFTVAEPTVTRLALLEMCSGVARWYSPRGPLDLDRLAGHYACLALRMLGSADDECPQAVETARMVVSRVW